ncbi:MAG TPA: 1-acyl-sn-glycerol-3-phosphate acyltransferase, partial [Saprospiraceae bacterium]|nr:1-acyl-sn-glycerol-3-phosphate acyltransferase [Saprospiraceae bacterium]
DMYNIILWWAALFLRLFFRRTIVLGKENIPANGPLIVASNHPSAFMEASVLATVMGRHIHFLVRGDVFNPKFRWLFKWTKQIPIYRQKDGISNLRKNASSFDLTYRKLGEGNAVLIFPEAKTVWEKKLRPLQRGTAHLAFGTLPFVGHGTTLQVIPVGVNFMDPRIPGTNVLVRFGQPFEVKEGTRENRETIEAFTEALQQAMQPLIIQVDEVTDEKKYDVLGSVYAAMMKGRKSGEQVMADLSRIAQYVNREKEDPFFKNILTPYLNFYREEKLDLGIYFPDLWMRSRLMVAIQTAVKLIWWLSGGWIWRLIHKIILSKMKAPTYQGPVAVGAAMVIYLLISLLLLLITFFAGWPWWIVPTWWLLLALGKFNPAPLPLLWGMVSLAPEKRNRLKKYGKEIQEKVFQLITSA